MGLHRSRTPSLPQTLPLVLSVGVMVQRSKMEGPEAQCLACRKCRSSRSPRARA